MTPASPPCYPERMTPKQVEEELQRLEAKLSVQKITPAQALQAAYALGGEVERIDAMHRACEDYSRARAAREQAFRDSSRPPPPK